jgi:carbonic anhydrase
METQKEFIKIECPKEHYTADACVLWCFDARFSDAYDTFLAQQGLQKATTDLVKSAGGAQALAADSGPDKEVIASQIKKSIMLHHTDRVVLMVHMDCGGYGGSKAFNNNHETEWNHHAAELKKATAMVHEQFPEIKTVESWIADFDGVHRIDG